jgi:hypothetical protein
VSTSPRSFGLHQSADQIVARLAAIAVEQPTGVIAELGQRLAPPGRDFLPGRHRVGDHGM